MINHGRMSLNWTKYNHMNNTELRNFGLTLSLVILILFGIFLPWLLNNNHPFWPWIMSTILFVWALAFPSTLRLLYIGWMKIGHGLGWINTRIILGLLFFSIFLIIGTFIRLTGKDPMNRKFNSDIQSYRIKIDVKNAINMERPF